MAVGNFLYGAAFLRGTLPVWQWGWDVCVRMFLLPKYGYCFWWPSLQKLKFCCRIALIQGPKG